MAETKKTKRIPIKVKREFYELDKAKPLVGEFVDQVPGKYDTGLLVFNDPKNKDEQIVISNYASLHDVNFVPGVMYEINYLGKEKTKGGESFHNFTVHQLES